jgi:hypothetical protein
MIGYYYYHCIDSINRISAVLFLPAWLYKTLVIMMNIWSLQQQQQQLSHVLPEPRASLSKLIIISSGRFWVTQRSESMTQACIPARLAYPNGAKSWLAMLTDAGVKASHVMHSVAIHVISRSIWVNGASQWPERAAANIITKNAPEGSTS